MWTEKHSYTSYSDIDGVFHADADKIHGILVLVYNDNIYIRIPTFI